MRNYMQRERNMASELTSTCKHLLLELRKLTDEADECFSAMSGLVISSMTSGEFTKSRQAEFAEVHSRYRVAMKEIIEAITLFHPDAITPVRFEADKHSFIEYITLLEEEKSKIEEIVNAQLNKFGLEECAQKKHNTWRPIMQNVNFKDELTRIFDEAEKECKRPNILVAGYTGSGKTSLIKTILGDIVPRKNITNSKPCRIDFDYYENPTIKLWDSRGLELGDAEAEFRSRMKDFIVERQDDPNVDEHIHLVWYVIQGNSARVTESDLALLKNIFTADDVIAVISKKDITKSIQEKAIRQILNENGIADDRIISVSDEAGAAVGCKELVALSCKMLPSAYRDAFMSAQSIDREARVENVLNHTMKAREIIASSIEAAKGSAEPPVPMADSAILIPTQIEMTAKLLSLYGLRDRTVRSKSAMFADQIVKAFTTSLGDFHLEGMTEINTETAGYLTGAFGHYTKNNFEAYAIARIKGTPLPELGFDIEMFKNFYHTYRQGINMKPNILVCGKTGVGKTTLIQAVTHRGVVPDSAIGNGKATTEGFMVYETEIANFIDSEGMNPGTQTVDEYADFILDEMLDRLESDEVDNLIHNIWYCIDGSGARIQDADARLIKTFSDKVILVVTKSELMRKEQTEAMMNDLLDLIDSDRIVLVSAENKTGLRQLVSKAENMCATAMNEAEAELESFNDRWDGYYGNMKKVWQEAASSEADNYIRWGAGRAAAIALIPLPLADVAPLLANEVYMIYKLAGVYGIAVSGTVITMLLGCAGGSICGKIGASFLPFLKIPIAAGVTYGVGKAAKAYFESEMKLSSSELKAEFLAGERESKKREWKPVDVE